MARSFVDGAVPRAVLADPLASYLDHLPLARREAINRLLATSPCRVRKELREVLTPLGARVRAERAMQEAYAFAPRRWGARALRERVRDFAHPGLRHLSPLLGNKMALPFYREMFGQSDLWLLRLPAGFAGELAAAVGAAATIVLTGELGIWRDDQRAAGVVEAADVRWMLSSGVSGAPSDVALFDHARRQPRRIEANSTSETLALIAVSPALSDRYDDDSWLLPSASLGSGSSDDKSARVPLALI